MTSKEDQETLGLSPLKIPQFVDSYEAAAAQIYKKFGQHLKLAAPLGLGKPNILLNLIYERAKTDFSMRLEIYTALSLVTPSAGDDLGARFYKPFVARHWGAQYPDLSYAIDANADRLPLNVKVYEFYFQAGQALNSDELQRSHTSINYTHVVESIYEAGVHVVVQLIAKRADNLKVSYSLSCNPDITLDLADRYKKNSKPLFIIGVIHPQLPYVGGEAEVAADFFNIIVEDNNHPHTTFLRCRGHRSTLPITLLGFIQASSSLMTAPCKLASDHSLMRS